MIAEERLENLLNRLERIIEYEERKIAEERCIEARSHQIGFPLDKLVEWGLVDENGRWKDADKAYDELLKKWPAL